MTEQIERELTELFRERTERLDVLPPLPAARVRRVRLQAALAMASVVAVLAAAGVVGVRLADSSGSGGTSIASSGSARAQLEQIADRMLAGRWRATVSVSTTTTQSTNGTSSAPTPSHLVIEADWDGPAKTEVARQNGQIVAIEIGDASYGTVQTVAGLDRYLPKGARWVRQDVTLLSRNPIAQVLGLATTVSTGPDGAPGVESLGRQMSDILARATVTRTSTGFRVALGTLGGHSRIDVRLRADGTISSVRSVGTVQFDMPGGDGETVSGTSVIEATYTPLSAPLGVTPPDPSTVVTQAQLATAFRKLFAVSITTGTPCPTPSWTQSPAAARQVSPDGSTGTATATISCHVLSVVPGSAGTSSPR